MASGLALWLVRQRRYGMTALLAGLFLELVLGLDDALRWTMFWIGSCCESVPASESHLAAGDWVV